MDELGVDINNDWTLENGDLKIIDDKQNLIQAVFNRLNCLDGDLDDFYDTYGGFLVTYFGWVKSDEALNFIQIECESILDQEPRLNDYEIESNYTDDGDVGINITVNYVDDETFEMNFILDKNGDVEVDDGD